MKKTLKYALSILFIFSLSQLYAEDTKLQGERSCCKENRANKDYSSSKQSSKSDKQNVSNYERYSGLEGEKSVKEYASKGE